MQCSDDDNNNSSSTNAVLFQCSMCCARFSDELVANQHIDKFHVFNNEIQNPNDGNVSAVLENEDDEEQEDGITATWNDSLTLTLINIMKMYEKKFDEAPMKKLVWLKMVKEFNTKCHTAFDRQKIENKWKTLKRTYKNIRKHNNSTGRNRKTWKFYDIMNEFLYERPEITAPATCSSSNGLVTSLDTTHTNEEQDDTATEVNSFEENPSSFSKKREKKKENAIERRHQEKLARLDKFNEIFERMVDKM